MIYEKCINKKKSRMLSFSRDEENEKNKNEDKVYGFCLLASDIGQL